MVPALQTSLQQPTYSSWNISVGDDIVLRFRREARCFQRKFNHQCCAVGMLVVRCDLSSMVANNCIADTKSHADTAPRGLCREKGIESSLRVGKALSIVRNQHLHRATMTTCIDPDSLLLPVPTGIKCIQRIIQDLKKHLLQLIPVSVDGRQIIRQMEQQL